MVSRAQTTRAYVPLWCKTYFSFLEGASSPEELAATAHALGLPALAVTDRDGVQGIPSAHVALSTGGDDGAWPRLIVGSEATIDDGSTLVLLAADHDGYRNLCRLITRGRRRCEKGTSRVAWSEVAEHAAGLLALWGGERSRLITGRARPDVVHARAAQLSTESPTSAASATLSRAPTDEPPLPLLRVATILRDAFGDRLYALVARHRRDDEPRAERRLRGRARRFGLPLVAAVEVLYHDRARRQLQDVLTCIRHRTTLAEAGPLLRPNDQHALLPPEEFARLFADDSDAVARTREVAARCTFTLEQLRYRYPSEWLPDGMTTGQWLESLTLESAGERFGLPLPVTIARRIRRELDLIHELDYDGYFLTMWEIVRFCREQGILCQGRGSAANSVVCYCLGITAVNPREVDLLFERFISRERAEPPDIDLDIEHERREEVIQHVYRKYGRERAAMVANVVRYRPKSALREVGKVLGLPLVQLDRASKLFSYREDMTPEGLASAGLDPASPMHARLLRLAKEIQDFPRHLSIHPGGFLLGHEPVHDIVPIENASMPDRTIIQWDKNDIEAMGLFKVDLLGLGALHQLHLAFDLVRAHRGREISLATMPRDDAATFAMLQEADSVGVFQVESRAQMAMLPRLRPRNYYDLVIQVAIVRPGPITGGMVHPYLRRRNGTEKVAYPHSALEPVLRKTLGVPLFQEQVMRLAMVAADYTPGEADQLRRDMAQWRRRGPIESHHDRLVTRMTAKGIAAEFAERVFDQIRGFGEYGFPESHAASFALIAYATAWVKRHYPAEFACSLLNAQPMGFYRPSTIVEDARHHGIEVRPVDVSFSAWECTLEEVGDGAGKRAYASPLAVRMGLRYVRGLAAKDGQAIVAARDERPLSGIADLARRTRPPINTLIVLAQAGALESLEPDRRQALWQVHALSRRDRPEQLTLPLRDPAPAPALAALSFHETIAWDWDQTSHSPRGHLLEPIREELRAQGWPTAQELAAMPSGSRIEYAGIVICRQRPATAKDVTFMTLEDETGFVNLVIWSQVYEEHRVIARTCSFLGVSGKIQSEDGVVHLIAERLWPPSVRRRPSRFASRDFH